ncbi:MAG: site-2 protease family protein, partial [Firmicutes bacterium]|nr:site-2 protease family protein [Bacillota bacterium]
MNVVLAIVGLGIVIFAHELGHYLGARLGGMRVRQLALGFGPRIFGVRYGGTDYRINAVPLGGYVLVAGYQDEESGTGRDDPSLMQNRPAWARAIHCATGPLFNLLLAAGLIGATMCLQGIPAGREVRIEAVETASPAERAGLRRDDILLAVNGQRVTDAAVV